MSNIIPLFEVSASFREALLRVDISHHAFVLGIFTLYSTLVDFGYWERDEIHWPPHANFSNDPYRDHFTNVVGFSTSVIELLPLLPYPTTPAAFTERDVLPGAWPISYLLRPDAQVRDPRFSSTTGNPGEIIPGDTLPWTGHIYHWLYNTSTKKLAPWDAAPSTTSLANTQLEWKAPEDYINQWITRLCTLEWLPDRHGEESIKEPPPELPPFPAHVEWRQHPESWYKNQVNSFRARRSIARFYGWPGPAYEREQCQRALAEFANYIRGIRESMDAALRADIAADPVRHWRETEQQQLSPGAGGWYPRVEREGARALTEFLEEAAGEEAVRAGGHVDVREADLYSSF